MSLSKTYGYVGVSAWVLSCALVTLDASAWGPRARKAITIASLESIRQHFGHAYKADASDYQEDLLGGAEAGLSVLEGTLAMNNDAQTLAAVQHEIKLLREVRRHGMGSFFAYRMGVLGALVAEVVLPYGIPYSESDRALKTRIDADLDGMVTSFIFTSHLERCTYIRSLPEYFKTKRVYYPNDLKLLADDYSATRGAGGFLREAGQTYFDRAVESVTDAWYTVLSNVGEREEISPTITGRYFVNEIAYLLNAKKNTEQADRAYRVFREVDPGMREAYETIGDLYYAVGTDPARERGVKEWQIAYSQPGPQRERVAAKLAAHYIDQGERMVRKAKGPTAANTDLEEALRSFQQALEFERNNDVAASRINETTVAIKVRRENYELQNSVIDNALGVTKEAERERLEGNFGAAIMAYNQVLTLLEVVDSEFKELEAVAEETRSTTKKAITAIYDEVLTKAEQLIEDGDRALEERRFEDAVGSYSLVEQVVASIPAEGNSLMADKKTDVVERSQSKVADAKLAQQRFQEDQAAAAAAAKPATPKKSPFN